MDDVILSVVIPSYNSETYIGECLSSLREEKCSEVEYILIDGGSTDKTMAIVEGYRDMFSIIVSEPDTGQSDAFNKGYRKAKGRYITWLNSDDMFCAGSLAKVLKTLKHGTGRWYSANTVYIGPDSRILRCCQSGGFEGWALYFGILNVFGPSTIIRRDLFIEMGNFREDFHFCMDTEYWWRLAKAGETYERIPVYFWALRLHDAAKTACSVTGDFDKRPARMVEEGVLLKKMYYPDCSQLKRDLGVLYVRILRLLKLFYVRAILDTFRLSGKPVSKM